jgi:trans-aconitate methyltransferase
MVDQYLSHRDALKSSKYLYKLLPYLPKRATILDVGCGAGVPVDDLLNKYGHSVTGLDISPTMIDRARRLCPENNYVVRDMGTLKPAEFAVDAVVSFYALFHIPRTQHKHALTTWLSYLPVGGMLLATLGDVDFEGEHNLHGVRMWSSQWGVTKNRALLATLPLSILVDEVDTSGGEHHHVILARKTAPRQR